MRVDQLIQNPSTLSVDGAAERIKQPAADHSPAFSLLLADNLAGNSKQNVTKKSLAAAAELMRLEMMRSAFSLASSAAEEAPSLSTPAMKLALQSFAANGPDNSTPDLSLSAGASAPDAGQTVGIDYSAPDWLENIVNRASDRYGVDAGLIKAVIKAESNFNPDAVSRVGAQGLMQLMPATAQGLGVTNSFDPEQNVMAGTRFLRDLLNRYGGDVNAALAAYNWGPGNVDRKPGALPQETRMYLAKVKKYYGEFVG